MTTFTPSARQLRVLAALAPGTLMLSADSFQRSTFLCTEDDRVRCGFWAITVDRDGNGYLSMSDTGLPKEFTYEEVQDQTRGALIESLDPAGI